MGFELVQEFLLSTVDQTHQHQWVLILWSKETRDSSLMLHESLLSPMEKLTTLWQEIDRRFSALAQAARANPEKVEAMARNVAWNSITYPIVEVILRRNLKVPHHAAVFAHKMIVLVH